MLKLSRLRPRDRWNTIDIWLSRPIQKIEHQIRIQIEANWKRHESRAIKKYTQNQIYSKRTTDFPLGLRFYGALLTITRLVNSFYLVGEPRNMPKILTLFRRQHPPLALASASYALKFLAFCNPCIICLFRNLEIARASSVSLWLVPTCPKTCPRSEMRGSVPKGRELGYYAIFTPTHRFRTTGCIFVVLWSIFSCISSSSQTVCNIDIDFSRDCPQQDVVGSRVYYIIACLHFIHDGFVTHHPTSNPQYARPYISQGTLEKNLPMTDWRRPFYRNGKHAYWIWNQRSPSCRRN